MSAGAAPDTSRATLLAQAQAQRVWDLVVIGGGATGLGVALDAAARGFSVVLLEADDFAKGTVVARDQAGARRRALPGAGQRRRWCARRCTSAPTLLANAPHLAQPLAFVMPGYRWWERGFYGVGLKVYDVLAGRRSLGAPSSCRAARDARPAARRVRRAA